MDGTTVSDVAARPEGFPAWTWRRKTAVLLLGILSLNACYSTKPVTAVPPAEMRVVLDLNDQGRSAYGERIGSSVRQVDGVIESADASGYVVRIASVRYLDGTTVKWAGERFRFSTDHVSRIQEREFSRSRTATVVALAAAALVLVVAAVKIVGSSSGGTRGGPGDGDGSQ